MDAPISFALSFKASKSFPVAPETADTSLIPAEKSLPTFTAATSNPAIGAVIFLVNPLPISFVLFPKASTFLAYSSI